MPRRSTSHPHSHSHSSSSATILATDRVLQKEAMFRNGIQKLHASSLLLAETIAISGQVETSLLNDDYENDGNGHGDVNSNNQEMDAFMKEQRMKLKALSERHVNSMRYIDAFMNATNSIKTDIIHQSQNGNGNGATDGNSETAAEAEVPDYETILQTKLEFQKHNIEKDSISVVNEEMARRVRQRLNEKEDSNNNQNNANGGSGGTFDDDDEIEIEIANNQGAQSASSLKCPLTGMLFTNPVRNKVCHHVYDKHAIEQHLRNKKKTCPVMGCNNSNVSMNQLEVDEEMKLKVRRYEHILKEKKRRDALSQDYDVDFDEEEEDGGDGAGWTVIE
jgi:hypothetical protein